MRLNSDAIQRIVTRLDSHLQTLLLRRAALVPGRERRFLLLLVLAAQLETVRRRLRAHAQTRVRVKHGERIVRHGSDAKNLRAIAVRRLVLERWKALKLRRFVPQRQKTRPLARRRRAQVVSDHDARVETGEIETSQRHALVVQPRHGRVHEPALDVRLGGGRSSGTFLHGDDGGLTLKQTSQVGERAFRLALERDGVHLDADEGGERLVERHDVHALNHQRSQVGVFETVLHEEGATRDAREGASHLLVRQVVFRREFAQRILDVVVGRAVEAEGGQADSR